MAEGKLHINTNRTTDVPPKYSPPSWPLVFQLLRLVQLHPRTVTLGSLATDETPVCLLKLQWKQQALGNIPTPTSTPHLPSTSTCVKGAVRRKIFYLILITFRSTFHMRKNSVLTKSISHYWLHAKLQVMQNKAR